MGDAISWRSAEKRSNNRWYVFLNFSTASRTGPNKKCQENKKSLHPEMFWVWVQSPHAKAKMVQAVQTGMASTHFLLQMLCLLA